MKVNRTELLEALKKVQPGLATKEIIEQSQSFVFSEGDIITYNDEIMVSCPCELADKITGAVRAEELFAFLSKIKNDTLDIVIKDSELRVSSKRAKAGIPFSADIELPFDELQLPKDDAWTKLPETFAEGIWKCSTTASRDMTKPVLTCIHLNGNRIESSDDYRITSFELGGKRKVFPKPVLLPAKSARELARYVPTEYGLTKGWVHFTNEDGVIFSSRVFEDEYPNVNEFLDVSGDAVNVPDGIETVLERVGIFSKAEIAEDESIEVAIGNSAMTISGEGDHGWFVEDVPIKRKGDVIRFRINPSFFKDLVDLHPKITVGEDRIRIETENVVHVVALMELV